MFTAATVLQIREDTEVLRPTATLQSGAFNIREDTEVLGNTGTAGPNHTGAFSIHEVLNHNTLNTSSAFAIREDTEVLNRTNNAGTGAICFPCCEAQFLHLLLFYPLLLGYGVVPKFCWLRRCVCICGLVDCKQLRQATEADTSSGLVLDGVAACMDT
jgi:hypothetical protein